jgi:hypothetical protein
MKSVFALCLALLVSASAICADPQKEDPPEVRYAAMLAAEYEPLGKTTAEILAHEKTHDAITLFGALAFRINAKPAARRTLTERKLAAVYAVQAEVNNGGFDQYFFNDSGDDSALALQGLREMGSAQGVKLMQRALNVFPGGKPPADRLKRQLLVERLRPRAAATWGACDHGFFTIDDLGALALAYAKKNRAQIVLL